MVKAALVALLTVLLIISSGNLAEAESVSAVGTVAPAGTKVKTTTTTTTATTAVIPKATKATTTATKATATTTTKTTTTATGTKTTAATTTKAKATTAPATKTLTKSKSTAGTTTTDTTTKKSLTKSASTNTLVSPLAQPSNGLPNWIGPRVNAPTGKACYRKMYLTKMCPPGYVLSAATCWAQCPIEYPVQCGMECIPQNKDCTLEVISKVNAVATVALNAATSGVFGAITQSVKKIDAAVRCSKQLYSIVTKAVGYIDEMEKKQPATTTQKLVLALKQSDIVVIDLPLGIASCFNRPIAEAFSTAKEIAGPVKSITEVLVNKIVTLKNKILEPKQFLNVAATAGVDAVAKMSAADASKLDAIVTCGGELKGIVDKIVDEIQKRKEESPTTPLDTIRRALLSTELVLVDIPKATNNCVPKSTEAFYEVRDQVRQAFQVIMDKVIDSSSQPISAAKNAPLKPLSKKDYALKIGGFGLDVLAMFEPTGFAELARVYIQKICGPTNSFGEIDDGDLKNALGLNMIGEAFQLSTGLYTKEGDGLVKINFISKDTEDVTVNIFSAGKLIDKVKLQKDVTVMWTKPMEDLKGKTLYLDRWRPRLPLVSLTNGGSLVMWIPHSSKGHIALAAVLNVSR